MFCYDVDPKTQSYVNLKPRSFISAINVSLTVVNCKKKLLYTDRFFLQSYYSKYDASKDMFLPSHISMSQKGRFHHVLNSLNANRSTAAHAIIFRKKNVVDTSSVKIIKYIVALQ